LKNFHVGDTLTTTAKNSCGPHARLNNTRFLFDTVTSASILAFDIEINRGDLRQLAPRKKLLKSCAGSSEPALRFSVSYLAHRSLSIAAQNRKEN
jgi:hypothetical protein